MQWAAAREQKTGKSEKFVRCRLFTPRTQSSALGTHYLACAVAHLVDDLAVFDEISLSVS